jgi:hypothetical protein
MTEADEKRLAEIRDRIDRTMAFWSDGPVIEARNDARFLLGLIDSKGTAADAAMLLSWERACAERDAALAALEGAQAARDRFAAERVEQEREACALIADSFNCGICGMDGKAADAIRGRSWPQSGDAARPDGPPVKGCR